VIARPVPASEGVTLKALEKLQDDELFELHFFSKYVPIGCANR